MLAALDVDYRESPSAEREGSTAVAGCVLFSSWTAPFAASQVTATTTLASDYRPGQFYLRELPALLAVLAAVRPAPDVLVIDGFVWLDVARPGLGVRLREALGGSVPVVGVAKNPWRGAAPLADPRDPHRTIPVLRGGSSRPIFVTAEGLDVEEAAAGVRAMHGAHRIPTLLKAVDRLVRDAP